MLLSKKIGVAVALLCAFLLCTSCGDTYRSIVFPVTQPGPDPIRPSNVYALYTNPAPSGQGILSKIDVGGDTNMANMQVGRGPLNAAYLGGVIYNSIFVVNSDNTVTYQIPSTFQLPITLNLFGDPTDPAAAKPVWITSNDTTKAYVVNSNGLVSTCGNDGSVSILSAQALLKNVCIAGGNPAFAIQAPNAGKVYVLNTQSTTIGTGGTPVTGPGNTVSVIDPLLQRVKTTPIVVGTKPVWAAFNADASRLYVVGQNDDGLRGSLTVVDTSTDAVANDANDHPLPAIALGVNPNFVVFEKTNNRLYITNGGDGTLSVIDLAHGDPTAVLASVATSPTSAATANPTSAAPLPDGTRIYVANSGTGDVAVIDATTFTLMGGNAGFCAKPDQGTQISCPNHYDTIPLQWDKSAWSTTVAPTAVPFVATLCKNLTPTDEWTSCVQGDNGVLRIETESTSNKVYVTTPYIVKQANPDPQSSVPGSPVLPGITVIRTSDNSIRSYLTGPQQDVSCQPYPGDPNNPPVVCPVQTPLSILSIPR